MSLFMTIIKPYNYFEHKVTMVTVFLIKFRVVVPSANGRHGF